MDLVDFLYANKHRREEVKHTYFESLPRSRVFLGGFGGVENSLERKITVCIILRQGRGRGLLFVIYSEDVHPSL